MNTHRLFLLLTFGLISAPDLALANDVCAKPRHTADVNECAEKKQKAAEKKLNAMYKKVLASLAPTDDDPIDRSDLKKSLIEAQRHWVEFRGKDCATQYGLFIWGTGRRAVYADCMREHAEDRIKTLKDSLLER